MAFMKGMQPSFAAGELSPALWARTDLAKYQTGLKIARNVFVHPHGGVSNCPGTWFVGETKYAAKKVRLISFVYSVEQAYAIEFGHLYCRFLMNGSYIMNGDVPYEITTPYTESMLWDLNYTQSADVLFNCHPSIQPKELQRAANNSWSLVNYDFKYGPFLDENVTAVTITPTGTLTKGGTVTLTASSSLFASTDVGELVRISQRVPETTVTAKLAAAGTTGSIDVEGEWNFRTGNLWDAKITLERSYDSGATWMSFKTYYARSQSDGNMDFSFTEELTDNMDPVKIRAVLSDYVEGTCLITLSASPRINNGVAKITSVSSGTVATATVQTKIYDTSATKLWSRGAWRPRLGYPRTVQFYQDRLCFGGSAASPNRLWFSETGDYNSFRVTTPQKDDNAINAQMVSRSVNAIRGLVSLRDLLVLTAGSEWKVSPTSSGAFSYKDKTIEVQGYTGSSKLEPLTASNSVLFVQEKGDGVFTLSYSLEEDGYANRDLTVFAAHLFEEKNIVSWCYQQKPWSLIWAIMNDGTINILTYMREHDVWAWSHRDTDGCYESVCSIPGDGVDEVYFAVKRTIGGIEKRYIERLGDRIPGGDVKLAHFLDCAGRYEGDPVTNVSGLSWLEGKEVTALADGGVVSGLTVENGEISLPHSASVVTVGLPYTAEIETLQIDTQMKDGTIQGRLKRVPDVILRIKDTRGIAVSPSSDRQDLLVDLKPPLTFTDPIAIFTGDTDPIVMPSGFDRNGGRLYIRQDYPLPMTILGIIPSVEIGG